MANDQGPWGGRGNSDHADDAAPEGGDDRQSTGRPVNPWDRPVEPEERGPRPSPLDALRGLGGPNGSGGGFARLPGRTPNWMSLIAVGLLAFWLLFTAVHRVGPSEEGVVTRLGKFNRNTGPGITLTLPAPIERLEAVDVKSIRTDDIGSASPSAQNLVVTGDQNLIDLAYSVRWTIKDPQLFLFQLAEPRATITEVGESAMRAAIANFKLNDAIGPARSQLEQEVQQRMQQLLDQYRSGVQIQGVAIRQADPPAAVNEAFKKVTVSQQQREGYLNNARAYAQEVSARAEGEAAQFDKVYEQYRLAPDVTRQRLYYETMEQVLSKTDKVVGGGQGVQTYLPLPELKRRADPATAAPSALPPATKASGKSVSGGQGK